MAEVTQPGAFHTAGGEHLEGIDFAGKTGTAQVMSHEALGKASKGSATNPNVWFVGVTPRRNPELVVAVLWQNGNKSWFAARIGAKFVAAYVEKQRRLAHNLAEPAKPAAPVEISGVWTVPAEDTEGGKQKTEGDRVQAGSFLVDQGGEIVARSAPAADAAQKTGTAAAKTGSTAARNALVAQANQHKAQPAKKPDPPANGRGQ